MEKLTLRAARINKGLTMREAAEIVNISDRSIANYESGKRKPRIDTLIRLANAYGMTLDQIKWE